MIEHNSRNVSVGGSITPVANRNGLSARLCIVSDLVLRSAPTSESGLVDMLNSELHQLLQIGDILHVRS